ncbi:MAG: ABC transporter ATP-binding protein [Firmicutes bacterium]|nr:ABC transporter ATP-binding protein [Bacillota bacterium]
MAKRGELEAVAHRKEETGQSIPASFVYTVKHLTVEYPVHGVWHPALRDVSLTIEANQITALIGESGSGKSTLVLALMNAVNAPGRIAQGTIELEDGRNVLQMKGRALQQMRGRQVGMVFQAAQNVLNPLKKIGGQILDLGRSHGYKQPKVLLQRAAILAQAMALDPDRVLTSYQHELSGGMRQRVSILMALVLEPSILLLDEPTTALDVLSQSAILQIIRTVHAQHHLSTVLITHDMGVVAELAQHVVVLYGGQIMETGRIIDILRAARHPYTQALIHAIPRLTGDPGKAQPLDGVPPELANVPVRGCVFRDRCRFHTEVCAQDTPRLQTVEAGHQVACHHWENLGGEGRYD